MASYPVRVRSCGTEIWTHSAYALAFPGKAEAGDRSRRKSGSRWTVSGRRRSYNELRSPLSTHCDGLPWHKSFGISLQPASTNWRGQDYRGGGQKRPAGFAEVVEVMVVGKENRVQRTYGA
jgi:hypothetical protein